MAIGDFNSDGKMDFVIHSGGNFNLSVYLGNGDGTFSAGQVIPSALESGVEIVTSDFNGDGILDLVGIESNTSSCYVQVYLGKGDGSFTKTLTNTAVNDCTYEYLLSSDFNGDGKTDLMLYSYTNTNAMVMLGNGDGTFAAAPEIPVGYVVADAVAGDLNGDGKPDIVLNISRGVETSVLLGNGDGTFTSLATDPNLAQQTNSMALADFNGDGQSDIAEVIADNRGVTPVENQLDILLSQSPNTAAAYIYNISPVGTGYHYVEASYPGDVNNGAGVSSTIPLLAEQVPTMLTLTPSPSSSYFGEQVTLTATLSQFFAQNHYASGSVVFTSGATNLGSASVNNGVATLQTAALTIGTDRLKAYYPGDVNFTTSTSAYVPYSVAPATNPTTFSVSAVTAPFGSTAGVTVTATEAGAAGPVTGGVVTFSVLSPATGSFSPTTCTLTAAGTCTTTYIPTGTLAINTYYNDIQASFAANNAYNPATANNNLTITAAANPPLTEPVNSTSPGQILHVTFNASGTLGAINVLTLGQPNLDFKETGGGGINNQPCTVGNSYTIGQTCAVFYTFTPSHPGMRYGGITLVSTTGVLLANAYIDGISTGPFLTFDAPVPQPIAASIKNAGGIVIDGAGNLFVGTGATGVFEVTAASGYTATTKLAGSFQDPSEMAIDGCGNLFVPDNDLGTVTEIFAYNGYTTTQKLISGLPYPTGVALDSQRNLFIADPYAKTVTELTSASGYTQSSTITNGTHFSPVDVAFDAADNLFVADRAASGSRIWKFPVSNGYASGTTIASGFSDLTSINVDAAGDLIVNDDIAAMQEKLLAATNYNTVEVLDYDFFNFTTIDTAGNVYGTNGVYASVNKLDLTVPPTLSFAKTNVGQTSTDSPQPVALVNSGNQPLIFTVPTSGPNPTITPGFTVGSVSNCPMLAPGSSAETLGAGSLCDYSVSFTPVAGGLDSGFLIPTDSNLNIVNATQKVPLNGTGVAAAPTVLSITPHSGPTTGGTTVTITGTSFTGTTSVRFGAVAATSFTVNSATQITAVSPAEPATTVDVTVTTPSGTTATSPADLFTFIPPAPPAVITLTGTPNPVFLLNPVTFTATVTASSYTPAGSVTFLDGTTPLNTVGLNGGVATLTTSTLTMGLHNITAVYNGPSLPPQTSAVLPELVEDFSLTITNPDVVIPHGGTGVFHLVVTTVGGPQTASTINFGIAGSPDHSPVTFSPASVAVGSGTTNVTLTIQTPDYPVGPWSSIARPPVILALTAFGALLLPFRRRRRRASLLVQRLLLFVLLASFATLSGCGSGWKTQNYPMTITASAGPLTHSVSATLTSKQ
jgi:hypothetical protein